MSNINSILSSPQRIEDNLSSRQLFTILDDLIARALVPVASVSLSFREMVAEIVASSVFTRRRVKEEQLTHLFAAFFVPPEEAVTEVQRANTDRAFLFSYLFRVSDHARDYSAAIAEYARHESRVSQAVLRVIFDKHKLLGTHKQLAPALVASGYWTRASNDFKHRIIEKYVKLIYSRANKTTHQTSFTVDVNDVFSVGYISASRAVDKFVSDSGVFTMYLGQYLNGLAKTRHTNGMGLSFGTSSRYAEGSGFAVPLDDAPDVSDGTVVDVDESHVLLERLTLAASDPDVRAAMLVSGIVPLGVPRRGGRVNTTQPPTSSKTGEDQ